MIYELTQKIWAICEMKKTIKIINPLIDKRWDVYVSNQIKSVIFCKIGKK